MMSVLVALAVGALLYVFRRSVLAILIIVLLALLLLGAETALNGFQELGPEVADLQASQATSSA